ncbi:Peptidyl-prolyl cis-trans isomerase-like 1 [Taxawa tesnikishii (nom. ined.)]|nr:Peptidyl-prolyl cis-trans isomerase-like 1 [Dothideales sp. JES 119]
MAKNVLLETTMGSIVLELYTEHAPRTCNNFASLADRNYYNNTIFHRIIPDFMIQGGDPTGTGRGGASIYGDKFEDEISPPSSTPFFITLAPTPWLDGKHTIFGRVKSGMRVVQRMGLVKTNGEDRPDEEVKILRARTVGEDEE